MHNKITTNEPITCTFLLRGAVNQFEYLQQGIAVVLIIIGLKMLSEHWICLLYTS